MPLFIGRVRTTLNTAPAPNPNPEQARQAEAGKIKLDHFVTRAERTVAASQELFAAQAARELRRH